MTVLTVVPTDVLVQELYIRGTTIKEIFGQYYEMDEMGSSLTVEDAVLAGFTPTYGKVF